MLFSIDRDGTSFETFYLAAQYHLDANPNSEESVILIEDEHEEVFGCFCTELWNPKKGFFGTHENFLFKFDKADPFGPRLKEKDLILNQNKDSVQADCRHTYVEEKEI